MGMARGVGLVDLIPSVAGRFESRLILLVDMADLLQQWKAVLYLRLLPALAYSSPVLPPLLLYLVLFKAHVDLSPAAVSLDTLTFDEPLLSFSSRERSAHEMQEMSLKRESLISLASSP